MDQVQAGERLTDTWVGYPVVELSPLSHRTLDSWRHIPSIDPVRLRCDIDDVIDPAL